MRKDAELLEHFDLTEADLLGFKESNPGMCGVDPSRISSLLFCQLSSFQKKRSFNTFSITDIVQGLEGTRTGNCTKNCERFKHPPLNRFWKAHISDASFLAKNIVNHWGLQYENSPRFLALWEKVVMEESVCPSPYGWHGRLAHYLVVMGYEERAARKQLTGEWLIFGKWQGENYYLATSRHSSTKRDDEEIFATLNEYCADEFPFLFSKLVP